ncbi:MAG: tetratricopeptide repeat protein [Paludibacteraceae bacterium]|nr:tetratricopeptide repeat protein [Paludibacteraceae bacterium]
MKGLFLFIFLSIFNFQFSTCHAQFNTDRITAIGRNALYFEDYVLSIQYFNQVIRLKPYLAEPYFYRAIAKIQLEDYQGALNDCNAAIERNPFSPGCYYTRGYIYRQLNRLQEAETDYSEALHFSPENRTYLLLRADTRAQMKQYDAAMEDIEQLLRREPNSPSVWSEKGQIAFLQADTLAALEAFEKVTQYDRTNPAAWSALGVTSLMLQREEEAYIQLTQAINLGSKWAGDYINRGIIYYRRHNYRGALNDYDQAVKLSPRNADCYYNRGVMRQEVGDYNHALEDLNKAIDLAPEKTEMRYQRALVGMQLKQWKNVITDLDTLIARYPYFLPAYYMIAQAYQQQGNDKEAYRYRFKAQDLEEHKEEIQAKQAAKPHTDLLIAQAQPQKKDHRKEFSPNAAQNQNEPAEEEQKYDSQTRGNVQKRYQDIVNEPQIILSYYSTDMSLRRTNYYHPLVEQINKSQALPAALRFTPQEMTLTAEMVDFHFAEINRLTTQIEQVQAENLSTFNVQLSTLYYSRAVEFAIIKDYASAIDDCTKAIVLADKDLEVLISFCRANWRYRLPDGDFELILRDYDHVIRLQPDFVFAYYNKANILCAKQEYKEAINYYTKAIERDADFAEAYFNRGLTYVFLGENEKGLADLSKAGELGIYQAYNMITRFK